MLVRQLFYTQSLFIIISCMSVLIYFVIGFAETNTRPQISENICNDDIFLILHKLSLVKYLCSIPGFLYEAPTCCWLDHFVHQKRAKQCYGWSF